MTQSPDMTRVYVVERLPLQRPLPDGTRPPEVGWLVVGQYDDPAEAGKHAADLKPTINVLNAGVRVRQFWVQTWRDPVPQTGTVAAPLPYPDPDVPLVQFQCLEHPTRTAKAFATAQPPRCPDCKHAMVPEDFANADITNLEELP